MPYTIKQAAEIMNVTPTTLRYCDKHGLLPFMERKESGYRIFSEEDIMLLRVIECLQKSGMPIKDIRQFSKWVQIGNDSLQETLDFINHKCWYYETAIEAGTEKCILKTQEISYPVKNKNLKQLLTLTSSLMLSYGYQ